MDSAGRRLVDRPDTVGGEEHDPVVILKLPQKDTHERIAVDVVGRPLLHEHIGFVQEQGGLPLA